MKKRFRRLLLSFFLMTCCSLIVISCNQAAVQEVQTSQSFSSECRMIQHQFGKTCVPLEPERIIALDPEVTLDPIIALGLQPVGFGTYDLQGEDVLLGVAFDEVKAAESVGNASQPSLEKIKVLRPDLILATENNNYDLLSAIAPTVSVPFPDFYGVQADEAFFKENLRYVANIFGLEEKEDAALSQYQERVGRLKEVLNGRIDQKKISVIYHEGSHIWTVVKNTYPITKVLDDLALPYASAPPGNDAWTLNIETIVDSEYDADILFIVDVNERGINFYSQHPILSNLKAIRNDQAYLVRQENWRGLGISAANKTLDDLFKYLPDVAASL